MKRSIALFLLTISAPTLAVAQEIAGGVTLGFGKHTISDIDQDLTTASLDGRANITFSNGFTLGVSAGYLDVDIDNVPVSLTADFIGLDVGYKLSNGVAFGVYSENLTAKISGVPIDISLRTLGGRVDYATGDLVVGAHIGRSSTSPDIGINIDNYGLTGKYTIQPNLDIGGAFLRAHLSGGGTSVDVDLVGIAAAYDVNSQVSIFGGVSNTSIDLINADITTYGIGAGYSLADMTGVASSVSLELARTDLSAGGPSTNLDTVRLGLTFPLGGKGTEAPLNSVADSIFNPRHGAVNAALTGAF
jgi:hypothetical protein